jgi:N utilization substance protein A
MQPNLNMVLEQVGKDKGIGRSVLVQTLEQAILTAAKKTFGQHREMEARYNEERGAVDLYLAVEVVSGEPVRGREITMEEALLIDSEAQEGDELLFQIFYSPEDKEQAKEQDKEYGELLDLHTQSQGFGRIAAQTAKQVIIQRVREAEREQIYNEYKDRKGELITGIVRRFERGNIIVDLGRAEAILPVSEQVPRESYRAGDRIVAYVNEIERAARGPQIVLSRTSKRLLEKLFEMEVPEMYEKIVRIESSAREPGARSKIAVSSSDRDVDPVGACVGMKGSRVQAVVQELRGEKIDIVPYDEDAARFVCNAIAPAEVSRVLIDAETHTMELICPDDKLSLAIGKKGQNVRLASQLSGWRIDIHSETKVRELEAQVREEIATIDDVDDDLAETMFRLGWRSAEEVANANVEELASIPGLGGLEAARRIQMNALLAVEREKLRAEIGAPTEEARLLQLRGVTEDILAQLTEGGYHSVEDILAQENRIAMADATGLTEAQIDELQAAAREFLELDDPSGEELTELQPEDGELKEFNPDGEPTEFKPDGEEFTEYKPGDSSKE